ncbi:MAG: sialate O-acetylesterase, partial [Bythopirellula sp.]
MTRNPVSSSKEILIRLLFCGYVVIGFAANAVFAEIVDVYLLGGQSNMQGVGRPSFLTPGQASQPDILLYHSTGVASSAGANTLTTLRPAGWSGVAGGFGSEIAFGERLAQLRPNSKIAIIKHAVGGTSLASDWNPGGNPTDTGSFGPQFNTFVNTVDAGLAAIAETGDLPIVRGMLWHQGEEDSKFSTMSNSYEANITHLLDRVREQWNVPDMPFVLGNVLPDPIGTGPGDIAVRFPFRDTVRQAQANVDQGSGAAGAVDGVALVSTDGFQLHGDTTDGFRDNDFVHLDHSGLLDLGHDYAEAIDALSTDNVLGDLTGDDLVLQEDWLAFRTVLNTSITAATRNAAEDQGDFNFDLMVDRSDFVVFKHAYIEANGAAVFAALGTSIPEPSTDSLLCLMAIALGYCGRKRLSASLAAVVMLAFLPSAAVHGSDFDVYLFAGQSNMEGVGRPSFLAPQQANQPAVMMYHSGSIGSGTNASQWVSLQPAGWTGVSGGFGPEIAFGERLSELEPDRNIAIIKHAVGGTSLAADWKPTSPVGQQFAIFRSTVLSALSKLDNDGHTYT